MVEKYTTQILYSFFISSFDHPSMPLIVYDLLPLFLPVNDERT